LKASLSRKVFLAGEGKHELGGRAGHPAYSNEHEPGVLESLLRKIRFDGWEIAAAKVWSRARRLVNLKVGRGAHGDTRTVLALALDAMESGCDVLVFSRDRDNDNERTAAVEGAVREVVENWPELSVAGAVAVPVLEAWILALAGINKTESMSKVKAQHIAAERGVSSLRGMLETCQDADLDRIPTDATSLNLWLKRARDALAEPGSRPR